MTRRRTRRREGPRPLVVLISGLLTIGGIFAFVLFSARAPREIPFLGYKTVYADVPASGNMRVHSEVRVRGVRVGEVVDVKPEHGEARLRIKLDPGAGELPADTKAAVRGKGLLGARFLTLEPGRSTRNLADGDIVTASKDPITLSVGDALDTFDAKTRGRVRDAVGGLGQGVLARGRDLNAALSVTPRTQTDLIGLTSEVLARPGAAARLVPSLDAAAEATAPAQDDLVAGLRPAADALEPFVDRRAAVRDTLTAAPPALAAAQPAFTEGRQLLTAARRLSFAAGRTLPQAPGGLRAATALLRESPRPLRRAEALLEDVRPAVPATLRITDAVRPLLDPVDRALRNATPLLDQVGRHGCDLLDFADNWRSVLNQGADSGGSLIGPLTGLRISIIAGPESISGFSRTSDLVATDRDRINVPCRYSRPQKTYGATR